MKYKFDTDKIANYLMQCEEKSKPKTSQIL